MRQDQINNESSFNKQEVLKQMYSKQNLTQMTGSKGENDAAEQALMENIEKRNKLYKEGEVIPVVKEMSKKRKFIESLELILKLNVDPTPGDQNIRGTCVLPAGTGKEVKICVFANNEFHSDLEKAGADFIGTDKTIAAIGEGNIEFDKIIATPEFMPQLKALARILGPKGLMPNLKSGTLVKGDELMEAVKLSKQGLIEFRVNESKYIMSKFGMRNFTDDSLFENLDALMKAIAKKKPESVKGKYFNSAAIKTSMGSPLKMDVNHYNTIAATKQN